MTEAVPMPVVSAELDDDVVNIYEELVEECVRSTMKRMEGVCHCSKCVADACALVLNQLEPRYVTTRKGELFSQVSEFQPARKVDITILAVHAIEMVRDRPRH